MTTHETLVRADGEEADGEETDLGRLLMSTAVGRREFAAAQALVEEGTILDHPAVRQALIVQGEDGRPVARWERMMGRLYTLGLNDADRTFLGLVLSLLPIGLVTLSYARDLDERRLRILLRAIVTLSGHEQVYVGPYA